jgi:hypothetical protein
MKPLVALLALLVIAAGAAQGDYVIIKINLAVSPSNQAPVIGQPIPGAPGFVPGQPGFVPGQPGVMPPGQPKPGEPSPDLANAPTVVVFLEYDKMTFVQVPNLPPGAGVAQVKHKFGTTYLYSDSKFINIFPQKPNPLGGVPTIAPIKRKTTVQQFEEMKRDLVIAKDKSPAKQIELAEFALAYGLPKQCLEVMEELAKTEIKDAQVKRKVELFDKVRKDLAQPVSRDDPGIAWKNQLNLKVHQSPHYALLYDEATTVEVTSRLDRLEKNMESFYWWFALKGRELPVPERRLVAVLVDKLVDFSRVHKACGSPNFVADGFYDRRDNVIFFSRERLDGPSQLLARHFTELVQGGWNLKNLLNPKYKVPANLQAQGPAAIAHAHTMALVKRLMEEESELATASNLGSRQLLTAIGFLPQGVEIPEAIQFGWSSFFETPKFNPDTHMGAFWPGTGAPSWVYHTQFRVWEMEKMHDDPSAALMGVLTDQYYREARQSQNPEKLLRARTYSWALGYFLSQDKERKVKPPATNLDGLLRYGQELSQLPRDLEFDGDVLLGCFARAFHLEEPGRPNAINELKFDAFAREWFERIRIEPVQMPELLQEAQRVLKERRQPARPPGPGFPGKQ